MLRTTQTSPTARLRAQTCRLGEGTAIALSGATSVMGPAKRLEILTTLKSSKWRKKHNISGKATFEECVNALIDYHLEPAFEDYVKKIVSSNNATRKALDKIIDDIPEDPTTKRLDEAEMTYIQQITEVDNALEEIRTHTIRYCDHRCSSEGQWPYRAHGCTEREDQSDLGAQGPARKSSDDAGGQKFPSSSTRDWGASRHPERMKSPSDSRKIWRNILQKRSWTLFLCGSSHGAQSTTRVCQLS